MAFSDEYCDLHGFERGKPYFTAHDHGNCSIIRVQGCDSLATESEYQQRIAVAAQSIGALLRGPNHSISITFERSQNNTDYIEAMRRDRQRDAQAKRLNAAVLIEETLGVLQERVVYEEILIACWTGIAAGYGEETSKEFAANRASWGRINAKNAMDPLVAVRNLEGPHMGFVNGVLDALRSAQLKCEILGETKEGVRRDLAAVRRAALFHETSEDWTPQATFERNFFEMKEYATKDLSGLFAPPLAQQIMTSAGKASSDMRSVEFGGRTYAVVYASIFPRQMPLFHQLSKKLERYDGHGEADIPWRYALHLAGGVQISAVQDIFNTMISFLSPMNDQKRLANMEVKALAQADRETFVGARLMAVTWIEPHEGREVLAQRRARLVRALESWNSPTVVEVSVDPMRALAETCAGMTRRALIARNAVAPVTEMALSFPFHRTAPFFSKGQSVMISPEGKPVPLQAHSPDQNFWLTLTPKRFCMDEFHKTGSTPSIVSAVEVMAREGRKWGLEIMLASQKIDDFESFKELASTIVLLDATDNATRRKLQHQFGFSEAVVEQLQELHGPRPNMGAAFVIGAKLKTNYHWLRIYNHLAPTLLWALDTTTQNRLLRKALVNKLGLERALKLLVARFPRGTAVDYVEQWKIDKADGDEDSGIYADMASALIQDFVEVIPA